ncbi:MAG: haloacid dehalogenase-like hydrolase [Planctomycetaceae bacterium]
MTNTTMNPKYILFDIDGTLLNTGGAGQRAMERALVEEFCVDFPFEGILTAGRTDRGIVSEIFARYGIEDTETERERFRSAYLNRLPECLREQSGLLLPGVVSLLERLAEFEHVTLSLLTGNYAQGAAVKLRHFDLDRFFRRNGHSPGGYGDQHADRDDVARMAVAALAKAAGRTVDGSEACVIGDTPADIRCARAVGARIIAVATGRYSRQELAAHDPDELLDDLSDTELVARCILDA